MKFRVRTPSRADCVCVCAVIEGAIEEIFLALTRDNRNMFSTMGETRKVDDGIVFVKKRWKKEGK